MSFNEHDHDIFYSIGTGGSFIDCIFLFYFYFKTKKYTNAELEEKFLKMEKAGRCHEGSLSRHYHNISDLELLNPNKKNIAINFSLKDIEFIFEMAYAKLFLQEPEKIDEFLSDSKFNKNSAIKEKLLKNLVKKKFHSWIIDWQENFDFSKMSIVIDFDTIYGRNNIDLHDFLADFLKVEKQIEVSNYIKRYQETNSKYFNT
jgi:hypothetical protein